MNSDTPQESKMKRLLNNIIDLFGANYNSAECVSENNNNCVRLKPGLINRKVEWSFVLIIVSSILLIVSWLMLLYIVRKMNLIIKVGERSQAQCGKKYIEYETGRYKLYVAYTEKFNDLLNKVSNIIYTIVSLIFFAMLWIMVRNIWDLYRTIKCNNSMCRAMIILGSIIIIISIVIYSLFMKKRSLTKLENRYTQTTKKKSLRDIVSSSVGITIMIIIMGIFNIWVHRYTFNNSTTIWIWMIVILPVIIMFLYAFNVNMTKINNEFIVPYSNASIQINSSLNNLRNDHTNTMLEDSIYSNMTVSDWINLILGRNIKRVHPDEEGDPRQILNDPNSTYYQNTMFAYLENAMGMELSELPDTVEQNKLDIRQYMRSIRHNDKVMLKPVKSFILQIMIISGIIIFIFSFLLFHIIYQSHPIMTTIIFGMVSFTLIMIFSLYGWYKKTKYIQ